MYVGEVTWALCRLLHTFTSLREQGTRAGKLRLLSQATLLQE